MEEIVQRAFAAYFKTGGTDQPSSSASGEREHNGRRYVVLQNVNGVLAVYRVRNDGILKRLKRWPHELEESQ